ncbi:MAG: transcription elongation factor GreA [Actinomycetota bacterium]|nr:transcription elongation factor GreA [Actinomycetota bacterium]
MPRPLSSAVTKPILATTLYYVTETRLSRQTFERLEAELHDLTTRGRIEIAAAIGAARALGDLRENGDYHAARDTQGKMEARIRQIQALLAEAEIVEDENQSMMITTGSIVHLRYEGDEDSEQYLIGSIEEKRPDVAVVSPNSPLGKAILGKSEGQIVEYESPGGFLRVEIVKIGV